MAEVAMVSLLEVFRGVRDGRDPRGVRHPMPSILALVFLGLLARIRELAVLERWAAEHWDQLREPLGFTRDQPPHATTISRALAGCSLAEFSRAFFRWVKQVVPADQPLAVAVDGKTSRRGYDADGEPVQTVTVFLHDLKLVLAQWSLSGDKTNEPGVLRKHLAELFDDFPLLQLITGDAIYAQRPLAEALVQARCDYLVQIKANQPEIFAAIEHCLGDVADRRPAAETSEKKGTRPSAADCGSICPTPSTFAIPWASPAAKWRCVLIGT